MTTKKPEDSSSSEFRVFVQHRELREFASRNLAALMMRDGTTKQAPSTVRAAIEYATELQRQLDVIEAELTR